ncbi:MAG: O-antigen ligase family protein, partial [Bacteroidota bacterium]
FLLWTLISSITAVQPVVGFKFLLNTFWYWAGFFVFSLLLFKQDFRRYRTWLWVTAPVLVLILIYTVGTHATRGFSFKASYFHMKPFYLEHTVYGAALALYFVGYLLLALESRVRSISWWLAWGLTGFVGFAFLTSYVRGAWGSVVIALGVWILAKYWRVLRLPFFFFLLAGSVALTAVVNDIDIEFTKTQDRTMFEHLQSAFDTETNLSNRERINRWAAAIDMTAERPVVGFGPGGYAFEFAEYQHALKMTEISQRSRNTIGTAHNELLRWSSEMGLPGAALFLILMVASVWRGVVGYRRATNPHIKTAYAIAFTTLLTYYVHSLVNNYFGMDKITIPLFMMLALITALDTWHLRQSE